MTVTTPALAAAFRLATSRPVHRHEWRPPSERPVVPTPRSDVVAAGRRRAQIRQWLPEGMPTSEMARRLQVSRRAVQLHIKAIKAEDRHGRADQIRQIEGRKGMSHYYGNPPDAGQFPYAAFLIERGSPAQYWVSGNVQPPHGEWTDDADKALKFTTEEEAKTEAKRLTDGGWQFVHVCGHMFNCGIAPEGTADHVRIWSGEHSSWWRADAKGYTVDINQAGIYTRSAAEECTKGAGPEKMLELRPVEAPPARSEASDAEKNAAFEWLREHAVSDAPWARYAVIALQEWSDLKARPGSLELLSQLHHSLQNTDEAIEQIESFAGEVLDWCGEAVAHFSQSTDNAEALHRWSERARLVRKLLERPAEDGNKEVTG